MSVQAMYQSKHASLVALEIAAILSRLSHDVGTQSRTAPSVDRSLPVPPLNWPKNLFAEPAVW